MNAGDYAYLLISKEAEEALLVRLEKQELPSTKSTLDEGRWTHPDDLIGLTPSEVYSTELTATTTCSNKKLKGLRSSNFLERGFHFQKSVLCPCLHTLTLSSSPSLLTSLGPETLKIHFIRLP